MSILVVKVKLKLDTRSHYDSYDSYGCNIWCQCFSDVPIISVNHPPFFAVLKAYAMGAFQKLHQESRLDFEASESWRQKNWLIGWMGCSYTERYGIMKKHEIFQWVQLYVCYNRDLQYQQMSPEFERVKLVIAFGVLKDNRRKCHADFFQWPAIFQLATSDYQRALADLAIIIPIRAIKPLSLRRMRWNIKYDENHQP